MNERNKAHFSEKKLSFGEMDYFGPKIAHPHNSASTGRIFLTFCTMKGAIR